MACLGINSSALVFIIFICMGELVRTEQKFKKYCTRDEPQELNHILEGSGKIELKSLQEISYLIHLNKDTDSGIELNVKDFLLVDHFLVIQGVCELPGTTTKSNVHFISGEGKDSLKFRIPFVKSFFMEICPETSMSNNLAENDSNKSELTVEFKRIDEKYEGPLPDGQEHQKIKESYEVQFKGKSPAVFADLQFVELFKEAVKKIAYEYSEAKNLKLDFTEPASKIVTIYAVHSCPIEWPDREICVSVRHSVFAPHLDNIKPNFELTANHLKEMWGQSVDSHLKHIELCIYQLPSKGNVTGLWLTLVIVPPIIIILFAYSAKKIFKYFKDDVTNDNDIRNKFVRPHKKKKTELEPNRYQTIPHFMNSQIYDNDRTIDGTQIGQNNYYAAILFNRYRVAQEREHAECSKQ